MCSSSDTPKAVRLATMQGTKLEYTMWPMHSTSITNTVAVSGVPNSAANSAPMPTIVSVRRSSSLSFNKRPMSLPRLPPSCSAAPSRPAEPPSRCVRKVATKISGAIATGTAVRSCMEVNSLSVPSELDCPSR